MLNTGQNMNRKQIFEEIPLPSDLEKEKGCISRYIYKAVFICVKLLLDIRLNLVKISEGKDLRVRHDFKKQSNPVIKNTDKIK